MEGISGSPPGPDMGGAPRVVHRPLSTCDHRRTLHFVFFLMSATSILLLGIARATFSAALDCMCDRLTPRPTRGGGDKG